MKNLFKGALVIALISIATTSESKGLDDMPGKASISVSPGTPGTQKLMDRLIEIRTMDIGSMTKQEKRVLRKEVKAIEKSMKSSGGVYVSAGGLLLIVLLLILLF